VKFGQKSFYPVVLRNAPTSVRGLNINAFTKPWTNYLFIYLLAELDTPEVSTSAKQKTLGQRNN
jgi:hypothetical protein